METVHRSSTSVQRACLGPLSNAAHLRTDTVRPSHVVPCSRTRSRYFVRMAFRRASRSATSSAAYGLLRVVVGYPAMEHGRKRSVLYALAGAALSALAPAGLLILREVASPRPVVQELFADSLTYAFVFLATAIVLGTLGFVLGRQTDRLLMLSATDPLTGLLNRRAFRRRLVEELHRSVRYGSPLSLMLVDVDGLKRLNDEHGHAAGDRAIQCVADAITHTLRGSDFGARWGGDEFTIVAPNASPGAASPSAERLAAQMRERGGPRAIDP